MTFETGDQCLLVDSKGRCYLLMLREGGEFHSHLGVVPHADLIGVQEGSLVSTGSGRKLLAIRPRFVDYVLKMRRGAQVVYPKDIGPILVYGDIRPGSIVVEAGTGSGALTIALVRAVGPSGRVISVERREDHATHARRTIERFFGEIPSTLDLRVGDVETEAETVHADRLVLDLPEPWHIARVGGHLESGGILIAYLPTVPQVQTLVETMREVDSYALIDVFETLHRSWKVEGRSVRPDHRMVGHTGFVVIGRRTNT
ncbi:tRNA (adenine(58)-N(1))-methyltransferase TrmI [bacterium BMS3Abin02]|nr:tRNA (adenine(58)-N(1))-methyltransferase TrmI [bacterium BMS3Abin02]GBE21952.1 tRNA (adenine(58)-N(1))-methyltransferase TrmI [bacterium BMS3Bbin01]HDH25338.1 tRNA (adenine-N1)-methyltransferase [Actinomycetota bacterium]HDL48777.1 tRNA (adenine-N1)-methyltransferase [Actinomycetota bacterium]